MVQHDIYTSGTLIFQVWIATILKMKNKLQKQNRNLVTNSKPHHIVSWAVFTCPHFHRFLLNKIAKIGENGGSCDNHAYNACKNQGVSGLNIASIVGRLLGDLKENCSCSMGYEAVLIWLLAVLLPYI